MASFGDSPILELYELLLQLSDNPIIALNHVVAVAMVDGAAAGLQRLETSANDSGWPRTIGCSRSELTCWR